MSDLRKVLIIKPSSLGDVATALPMAADLKFAAPRVKIDWLVHPSLTPLVEGHAAINKVILFDRRKLAPWWRSKTATLALRDLLRKLREAQYDAVIDAQGLFRSAFLTYITNAKIRIGFANAREGATLAYTHKVKLPDNGKKMLAVDRMRALLQPLGIKTSSRPAEAQIPIQPEAAIFARQALGQSRPVIVIPGARWATKRWPIDRYTTIVQQLLREGQQVLLLGSPDEKPLCDQIEKSAPEAINLAGQTNLAQMIALLDRAKLLIANDSGPLHVAVALNKPAVSLYGPTSPDFVGPYGQMHNVLRHDVPCHPCRRRECDHHSCMNGLTTETVWTKTLTMLNPKAGAGGTK